jgi:hypothetical protein
LIPFCAGRAATIAYAIAEKASQGKIILVCRPLMFLGDDVVNFERNQRMVLGQVAILTSIPRALTDRGG